MEAFVSGHSGHHVPSPDAQEFRLLSGRRRLRLHFQGIDVGDGNDGGSDVPRQAHEGADDYQDGHPEQIQVIPGPFLQRKSSSFFPNISFSRLFKLKIALILDQHFPLLPQNLCLLMHHLLHLFVKLWKPVTGGIHKVQLQMFKALKQI